MNVVKRVRLVNFRNHEGFELDFRKKMTIITGGNGWGKTSVIEAIYLGCVGKSFRGVDAEIVRRGEEFYKVELMGEQAVVVRYEGGKRSFEAGGKKSVRLAKQNKYPVVLFLPSDLYLVGSSPTRRREYFDAIGIALDGAFHSALSRYGRALRQRNEILKMGGARGREIFAWNVLLARYGVVVAAGRRKLAEEINRRLEEVYRGITGVDDGCGLQLMGVEMDEGEYLAEMDRRLERDRAIGHTSFGVHRDEWRIVFNGRTADGNASRGETRSILLALKFIEAELLEAECGKKPVILLDDVFSELDERRREKLVENFRDNQIIITSVTGITES